MGSRDSQRESSQMGLVRGSGPACSMFQPFAFQALSIRGVRLRRVVMHVLEMMHSSGANGYFDHVKGPTNLRRNKTYIVEPRTMNQKKH